MSEALIEFIVDEELAGAHPQDQEVTIELLICIDGLYLVLKTGNYSELLIEKDHQAEMQVGDRSVSTRVQLMGGTALQHFLPDNQHVDGFDPWNLYFPDDETPSAVEQVRHDSQLHDPWWVSVGKKRTGSSLSGKPFQERMRRLSVGGRS